MSEEACSTLLPVLAKADKDGNIKVNKEYV